jgi:hypothetical protein
MKTTLTAVLFLVLCAMSRLDSLGDTNSATFVTNRLAKIENQLQLLASASLKHEPALVRYVSYWLTNSAAAPSMPSLFDERRERIALLALTEADSVAQSNAVRSLAEVMHKIYSIGIDAEHADEAVQKLSMGEENCAYYRHLTERTVELLVERSRLRKQSSIQPQGDGALPSAARSSDPAP